MRMLRARTGVVTLTAAIGCGLFAFAGTGTADTHYYPTANVYENGKLLGSGAVVNSIRTRVSACDLKPDGLGVRTHFTLRDGAVGVVGDGDGSTGGCDERFVTTADNPVVYITACAGRDGEDTHCSRRVSG